MRKKGTDMFSVKIFSQDLRVRLAVSILRSRARCVICFFIAANMEKKGPLQSVQVFGRKVSQNDDEEHNGRHWILWRSVL